MPSAQGIVAADASGRTLAQPVKHFAHKLPTTLAADNSTGRIEFAMGPCDLTARDGTLHKRVEAATGCRTSSPGTYRTSLSASHPSSLGSDRPAVSGCRA